MLRELHVEDFALIDRLELEFGPGLTVLTGETGAGKSIVVDAINAMLGERVDTSSVREGAARSVVRGVFDSADGAGADGGRIELSREVSAQGKTQCRVGGRPSTLSAHREITQLLADVHGQHEHQLLLSPRWQLAFLDGFAGPEAAAVRGEFSQAWTQLQQAKSELARLSTDERERARLADLYRFQVGEIEQAGLRENEDAELAEESLRLANLEKLFLAAQAALAHLAGGDSDDSPGAEGELAGTLKTLEAVSAFDLSLGPHIESLNESLVRVQEVSESLRRWREDLEMPPGRLDEVQERLERISALKRKYGETIPEVLAYCEQAARELQGLETSGERRAELGAEVERLEETADGLAGRLSDIRQAAAPRLERQVEGVLADLSMTGAKFLVSVSEDDLGPSGGDHVEFLISANPGESPRPLRRVASGGEASRIMLALKDVMASSDPVRTLIFDEIDSGIGGRTATVVGEKLKKLAAGRQVLCVTHLAQIARFADQHLFVEKSQDPDAGGRTVVRVSSLSPDERVAELARMLGGDHESEAAVQHARELLGAGATEDS